MFSKLEAADTGGATGFGRLSEIEGEGERKMGALSDPKMDERSSICNSGTVLSPSSASKADSSTSSGTTEGRSGSTSSNDGCPYLSGGLGTFPAHGVVVELEIRGVGGWTSDPFASCELADAGRRRGELVTACGRIRVSEALTGDNGVDRYAKSK